MKIPPPFQPPSFRTTNVVAVYHQGWETQGWETQGWETQGLKPQGLHIEGIVIMNHK